MLANKLFIILLWQLVITLVGNYISDDFYICLKLKYNKINYV